MFKVGDLVESVPVPEAGRGTVTGVDANGMVRVTFPTWYGKSVDEPSSLRLVADSGPIRTVTRQEIVPGTYDGVVVSYEHDHRLIVHFKAERPSADTLDRAAAVLTALAGALRDG